jgi:hypothetical protein
MLMGANLQNDPADITVLLGLIAELVMGTYCESQNKKTYPLREVIDPEENIS